MRPACSIRSLWLGRVRVPEPVEEGHEEQHRRKAQEPAALDGSGCLVDQRVH